MKTIKLVKRVNIYLLIDFIGDLIDEYSGDLNRVHPASKSYDKLSGGITALNEVYDFLVNVSKYMKPSNNK